MSIKSNFSTQFIIAFLSIFLLISTPPLDAGWGQTDKVVEFDDIEWNQVFYKMNGLHYTAYVPGYMGATLEDTSAYITGAYAGAIYLISTDIEDQFIMPSTQKEFLKHFDSLAEEYTLIPINAKALGAKYAVDLIPKNDKDDYLRFIATKNHLIVMYTNDLNEDTRHYFFNSLTVHPK